MKLELQKVKTNKPGEKTQIIAFEPILDIYCFNILFCRICLKKFDDLLDVTSIVLEKCDELQRNVSELNAAGAPTVWTHLDYRMVSRNISHLHILILIQFKLSLTTDKPL